MPRNNSKYAQEIREKTARCVLKTGKSATSVAEEMGIDIVNELDIQNRVEVFNSAQEEITFD